MAFLLKSDFHRSLADTVFNEFLSQRSNYYYFIGNILEWPDPLNPESPEDTQDYSYFTRNGLISVHKLNLRDISYVIPRINWTAGTVYDQYDGNYSSNYPAASGATSLYDAQFYVLTSNFDVYKCIFNNNNSPSTVEPNGHDLTTLTTGDGYVWKYLYTIPLSSQNKFLTDDYMPVQRAVTNAYYSKGEISSIVIDNPGANYLGNAEVTLSVVGEFLGLAGNSIANLRPVLNGAGEFIDIIIDDPGANYKYASIQITDNLGKGASHNNGVSNVRIFSPGSDYFSNVIANTTVVISTSGAVQPASNAQANLIFSSNQLVDIVITNPGSQYSAAAKANTTITISTTGSAQPTSNATANLYYATTAILKPVIANGTIQSVVIEDQGKGYSSNIQTVVSIIGDGVGAVLTPFINASGQLEDIIIEERGSGYTKADLAIIGAGTNANARVNLSTNDLETIQTVVEIAAVSGGLHAFRVHNGGNNYSHANISISGDGSGFIGNVIIANNSVSYISVIAPGSGYTFANVTITGDGANANVSAILPPFRGHGSDPVRELHAETLMFTSTINADRNHGIDVNNDYRQFGILKDIKKFNSDQAFGNAIGSGCYLATMDTVSGISIDDRLTGNVSGTKRYFDVVEIVPSTNQLLLISKNNRRLHNLDVITDETTNTHYTVQTVDHIPDINKFSGDLFYIDNRTSISHSGQQSVTLRTVISL